MRVLCLFWSFFISSCTVGLQNARMRVPEKYSKIYIPAATDSSVSAGNAARVSSAIRGQVAKDTDVQFTNLEEARLALQIKILDRTRTIQSVDSCNNAGTPTIGSGAFACSAVHPEMLDPNTNLPSSFNLPNSSPSSESVNLQIQVRAIDLNSGAVIWGKIYNVGQTWNEIGDTGDGRTASHLQFAVDLHALRSQEALDTAVQNAADSIAVDVRNQLFSTLNKRN